LSPEGAGMSKVLLVEDDPLLRVTMTDALEDASYEVIAVEDANQAMQHLAYFRIDALLADIKMPGTLSGIDLSHIVSSRWPDVIIFLISGRSETAMGELPPGAEFFQKPFSFDHLNSRLQTRLAERAS
jgi:two-component system cell cycle response regulator CpdR